jgi:cell division protein FtsL
MPSWTASKTKILDNAIDNRVVVYAIVASFVLFFFLLEHKRHCDLKGEISNLQFQIQDQNIKINALESRLNYR